MYGIPGFFYQTFLTLERTHADQGFFCDIQRKKFFAALPFWPLYRDPGWVKIQDLDPGFRS
jgi:hypothetical protein